MVVSAGSSVGARDETAGAVAALGEIWCHGLAVKPGKPTLLAECAGVPLLGLPGNPLSALVVFRLVGVPLVWRLAGCRAPPPEPTMRARLSRDLASATGRLDVVQVAVRDGVARAAVRALRAAVGAGSGGRLPGRPGAGDRPRRRHRGGGHPVPMTPARSCPTSPPSRPGGRGGTRARPPAAHPGSTPCCCRSGRRSGGSPRSRCGRRRSSPAFDSAAMDGIAVRAAETVGAAETTPVLLDDFAVVDTGDPLPAGYDAVVMREHVHHTPDGRAELRAAVPPYQHVRSIGEDISATELLLPEGHRLRPVDVAACAAAGVVELPVRRRPRVVIIPTGDEIRPVGTELAPGEIADTNSMMLAAQAAEVGCETRTTGIVADDPELITAAVREAAVDADLVILIAGSSAGRDDYTARVVAAAGSLAVHGVAVRPGHPVVLGTVAGEPATAASSAPPATRSRPR